MEDGDMWGDDDRVVINDLYSDVVGMCDRFGFSNETEYPEQTDCTWLQPNGVHFGFSNQSSPGRQFTATRVAAVISAALS